MTNRDYASMFGALVGVLVWDHRAAAVEMAEKFERIAADCYGEPDVRTRQIYGNVAASLRRATKTGPMAQEVAR